MQKIYLILFISLGIFLIPNSLFAQLEFVQNKGQWHQNVQYRTDFNTGSFYLENQGFTVALHKPEDVQALSEMTHGHGKSNINIEDGKFIFHSFAYKVKFLGSNTVLNPVSEKPLNTYNNYFIGNDKTKWASECFLYEAVTYKNIYPNIDVRYYSNGGKLKYDFIVYPGGNVDAIAMRYDGPQKLSVIEKELNIETPFGAVKELYPYSYQTVKGSVTPVNARYIVKDNVVSFKVDKYNSNQTLIIDPSIIFSSFTGSRSDNWGYTATPGPDGSLFAGGIVFGSQYPVSPGAYDVSFGGGIPEEGFTSGYDIAIFKFSASGSNRLYATYLGGSENEQPHSMICDAQGNLIVAGRSKSPNYPQTLTSGNRGNYDIVITKFNASGTNLIGSAIIGGSNDDGVNIRPKWVPPLGSESIRRNYGDDARSEVILDESNNIYLASSTQGVLRNGNYINDFPVVNSPIQTTYGGGLQDGVVLKLSANLSNILFSTYFGGNGNDACFVASINPVTKDLFIGGVTESATGLPGDKTNVIGTTFNGPAPNSPLNPDGFVTYLKNDGSAIFKTSYFGSAAVDMLYGLKFDRSGFPYIMGSTTGTWPVVNATYRDANAKQFISKLQPDLSAFVYSTNFGNASPQPNISPIAFLVDRCENVYVSGWGGGINNSHPYSTGNTFGLPETNPLSGIPAPDGADFYFFVLEKNAQSRLFASHYGQNGGLGDHVDGGTSRFDDNGVIYQAICANCGGNNPSAPPIIRFPTTPGAWAVNNGSLQCNQVGLKIEMNFAGVGGIVKSSISGSAKDTSGCIPLTVNFRDTLLLAKKYYWNFGDGSPQQITYAPNNTISHTYTTVGTFRVMLISEDSLTCNIRDTSYLNIKAGNNKAFLAFTPQKLQPCDQLRYQFVNNSTSVSGAFGPASFTWDFGDGSPKVTAGLNTVQHTFATPGTYNVKLTLTDDAFCNAPLDTVIQLRISPLVKASFTTAAIGCAPYVANFTNTSLAGSDFKWQFEDGTVFSTALNPTYTFNNIGNYRVRLIASDTNTCNKIDTSGYFTIRVLPKPVAAFIWAPNPPQENVPVSFTNQSIGALTYQWSFGDGDTSVLTNPAHEYNATGTYKVTLVAFNEAGCTDTAQRDVPVIIVPALDVPNAFTPSQPGTNSKIFVRGFGITKLAWKIYNRWGQLVFESNSKNIGWDGTFKGKLQPIDVYVYTLDVEFSDGKKLKKTGDISLLR